MEHKVYRIIGIEVIKPYTLRVKFDDGVERVINLLPVLEGPVFGALKDESLFNQVTIDPEAHTLVWPNGADFDPETLHEWHKYADAMKQLAKKWKKKEVHYA